MTVTASTVFLVQPDSFGFNEETAVSNTFQKNDSILIPEFIREQALSEFNTCINILKENNINTIIYKHEESSFMPDAVFPNNWFCHLPDGQLFIFPMESKLRRKERIPEFREWLRQNHIMVNRISDLSKFEEEGIFLEGTGSLILDHKNKIGWAAKSSRTIPEGIEEFSIRSGYRIHIYDTIPFNGTHVYHTNVIQAISPNLMILAKSLVDTSAYQNLEVSISATGRKILSITESQMQNFCGNILFLNNKSGLPFWIMSETAKNAFTSDQILVLEKEAEILSMPIPYIEKVGGGSARCMLAEIFS